MQRYEIEGHLHYTTSVTNKRVSIFLKDWACQIIIQTLNFYINRGDVCIIGYVIMPDHLHMISFPKEKVLISNFLKNFHKYTAKEIIKRLNLEKDFDSLEVIKFEEEKKRKHHFQLWQGNSYDFNIISYDKLFEKLNYMHNNPI